MHFYKNYVSVLMTLLIIFADLHTTIARHQEIEDCEHSIDGCGLSWWKKAAFGVAAAGGTVVGVTVGLPLLGFTSAGIAAGSVASGLMSTAAVANGGGVVAGGIIATAQSLAAAGISATTAATVGVGAYAAAETVDYARCKVLNKKKDNNEDL